MRIQHIAGTAALAASAALFAVPACAFTVLGPLTVDVIAPPSDTVATVSFDGGTAFGSAGSSFATGSGIYGFTLSVPGGVSVSDGSVTFRLPDITVSGAAGWMLSDPRIFLGNLMFAESGVGSTSAHFSGVVHLSGWTAIPIAGDMFKSVTSSVPLVSSQGFFSTALALPGPFTRISFTGGDLTLTAAPGSGSAAITSPSQNQLRFSFNAVAVPVPEPATWAMLMAGLLWVSWVVRPRSDALLRRPTSAH